jgi:hypothetical protein
MISAAENIWTVFLISTAGELSALRLQLSGSSNGKLIRLQLFSYGLDFRTADSPNSEDACATEIEPNQAEISPIFGQWIANPNGLGLISEASVEPVELTLVFNLPTSGQYQIFFVFPACDNISCLAQRSLVAVEMSMVSSGNTFSTQIDQRSNGISSVLLYTGAVDGADRGFKPIITVRSLNSNNAVQATSVAMDVIRFVQQQSPVEQSQTFVLLDLNARDANSAYTIIPGMF